ncbi:MAG: hypothetical protein ACTSQI_02280 [Candidatus Helarchaeota archaeon]
MPTDKEIYDSIPDFMYSKPYLPFCQFVWRLLKKQSWEDFWDRYDDFVEATLDELVMRMEEAIALGKKLQAGELKNPDKVVSFWILPPVLVVRSDLQQGAIRLIYGNSADISFMACHDLDKEVQFVINFHFEQGLATNYWYIRPGDELLEKRHMKLGTRLKDIPKEIPDFHEAGSKILDILRDIRNEQDPDHVNSAYNVCMFLLSAGSNNGALLSNYSEYSWMWEGINMHNWGPQFMKKHGKEYPYFEPLKKADTVQFYEPWPPIFYQLTKLPRPIWIKRIAGLLTNSMMYFQYIMNLKGFDKVAPVRETMLEMWEEGEPSPQMILNHEIKPYGYQYPKHQGPRIYYWDLGIKEDDVLKGFLTNITFDKTYEKFDESNLVSIGHGIETVFVKKDDE